MAESDDPNVNAGAREVAPEAVRPAVVRSRGRMRGFSSIRPVEEVPITADLSNLDTISLHQFREALRGGRKNDVLGRAVEELRAVASQGVGLAAEHLPPPLHQTGLECQTMALLNGIQAWEGPDTVRAAARSIDSLRQRATAHSGLGERDAAYSMSAVAEVLKEDGLLASSLLVPGNPIQAARDIFRGHTFLGVGKKDSWHAYTVLPATDPNAFAWRVDSLGGTQRPLTPEDFLGILVNQTPQDLISTYKVARPS